MESHSKSILICARWLGTPLTSATRLYTPWVQNQPNSSLSLHSHPQLISQNAWLTCIWTPDHSPELRHTLSLLTWSEEQQQLNLQPLFAQWIWSPHTCLNISSYCHPLWLQHDPRTLSDEKKSKMLKKIQSLALTKVKNVAMKWISHLILQCHHV